MNCPWGVKAFTGYLGDDREAWKAYDASVLAQAYAGPQLSILADQGTADDFLTKKQLLPEALVAGAKDNKNLSLRMRMQEDYDHSYYFISTFVGEHIGFHANFLRY